MKDYNVEVPPTDTEYEGFKFKTQEGSDTEYVESPCVNLIKK
jgi:hypothetical protein